MESWWRREKTRNLCTTGEGETAQKREKRRRSLQRHEKAEGKLTEARKTRNQCTTGRGKADTSQKQVRKSHTDTKETVALGSTFIPVYPRQRQENEVINSFIICREIFVSVIVSEEYRRSGVFNHSPYFPDDMHTARPETLKSPPIHPVKNELADSRAQTQSTQLLPSPY